MHVEIVRKNSIERHRLNGMDYLKIENSGEVSPLSFSLMGASTKRDDSKAIGMFGTGASYAVSVLMRNKIELVIYSGVTKIQFTSQPVEFRGKTFGQVMMKVGSAKAEALSITEEMGKDWDVEKGLRELVSNAYDEGKDSAKVSVASGRPIGEAGKTLIYVALEPVVRKFWTEDFDKLFTLERGWIEETTKGKLYSKQSDGVSLYRRGVRVFKGKDDSLFDYEDDNVSVSEDRTAGYWETLTSIAKILNASSVKAKAKTLQWLSHNLESSEANSYVEYCCADSDWAEALTSLKYNCVAGAGVALFLREELSVLKALVLPDKWYKFLTETGTVKGIEDYLSAEKLKGYNVIPLEQLSTMECRMLERACSLLKRAGYDKIPTIEIFATQKKDALLGEWVDEKILLNRDLFHKGYRELVITLMEEVFHGLSGYSDHSRLFQTFLINEILNQASERLNEVV